MSTMRMKANTADHRCIGIYVRRSDEDDSGKSRSSDDQELQGRRFAAALGYPPERIRIYREDDGVKGMWWFSQSERGAPYRPELSRMLDDMENDTLGACWTWRSDRIVRDVEVCLALVPYFTQNKVRLWCGLREIDVTTADGLYNLTVEAAANRRQRDRASEDGIQDKAFRAEIGLFTRDPSAYGWRSGGRDSQEAVPQWHEIAVAEMMMRWFVYGDGTGAPLNLNQIANRLMDLGIPLSVGARGHKVRDRMKVTYFRARAVISNPMFVAKWRHGGEEHDFWDKLAVSKDGEPKRTAVPTELFDTVQERLQQTERPGLASDRSDRLCSGIVVCGCCGRTMHVNVKAYSSGEKFERFYCSHRTGRRKTCTNSAYATIAVDELNDWVMSLLAPLLVEELRAMQAEVDAKPLRKELQLAERQLAEARRTETEKLAALVSALDSEQIAAVATQLRAERQRAERAVDSLKERIGRTADVVVGDLASLQSVCKPRLREALRRAVRFVAISKCGITVLTWAGNYIVAPFVERDLTIYSKSDNRRRIERVAEAGGPEWIPSHQEFVSGRRRCLGKAADKLADDQILPSP